VSGQSAGDVIGLKSRWRRYPAYKDSEIEWLGEIPAHWEVKRLKYGLIQNDGGVWGEAFDDEGTIVLRSTEMTLDGGWRIDNPARRRLTSTERRVARLVAGDLVVTKSSGSALHLGKTALVTEEIEALDCCFSNFTQRLRSHQGLYPRLLWYLLNSPIGREQLNYFGTTTTGLANLNGDVIGSVFIPWVPLPDQRAIADFLDCETAKIDALIAKNERLIELLQEKRAAIITRAVTKGLAPHAPMKDSGVEWLGEIPAHWDALRLKVAADLVNERINGGEGMLPYIAMENVESETGKLIDTEFQIVPESVCSLFQPTDVLFGKLRPYLAKVMAPEFAGCCSSELIVLRPRRVLRRYLFYYCLSDCFIKIVDSSTYGAKMPRANWQCLGNMSVPIPPIVEQRAIADFLDCETARIETFVRRVQQVIEKLQEYRAALITAAVTGQIDVREELAKTPIPANSPHREPLRSEEG